MASVCMYFQVHQPFRLRKYSVFDNDPFYYDNEANKAICEKVANKCYRPATAKILDLVKRHEGRFRVSYSITGTALEQLQLWAPDVIDLFQQLAAAPGGPPGAPPPCEFLAETSHHSLCFLFSREEFSEQLAMHDAQIKKLFNQEPTVFRNTELNYSNDVATHIGALGRYKGILCEGVDKLLGFRSPNYLYVPPGARTATGGGVGGGGDFSKSRVKLLLKNYRLSDDIAFRFGDRNWSEWPLRAETFAKWVDQ